MLRRLDANAETFQKKAEKQRESAGFSKTRTCEFHNIHFSYFTPILVQKREIYPISDANPRDSCKKTHTSHSVLEQKFTLNQ